MRLVSSAFEQGKSIPRKYTCQGINISPPLTLSDVPKTAKSLVLIMDDPDVPAHIRKEQMYDHWVVYDIAPSCRHIEEGVSELGTGGLNTAGTLIYVGPCPPDREHRYFFKVYALDCLLELPAGQTKGAIMEAVHRHVLAEAELMGRYLKT